MFAAEEKLEALDLTSGWFLDNVWLIALVPAVGFAVIMMFGKRLPRGGSEIGLATIGASFVLATGAAIQWIARVDSAEEHGGEALGLLATFGRSVPRASEGGEVERFIEPVVSSWTWWQNSGLEFGIGSFADGLSVLILWLVAFVSLLVQIFSLDYVRDDRRYTQFFGALTLFSAGMLVMVMAGNMVQLILGWEIMGLCSFMLIGHWWEEDANSKAALKAFFTVRVGDVGLLVGTSIIYFASSGWIADNLPGKNGFDIDAIQAWALSGDPSASGAAIVVGASALFVACIGKSGQFPLHTWLPDAMAGPTPVSSLLHSSTMVVAGVFLVARIYPVFWEGFNIANGGLSFIAIIGAITIVIAALLAFVQDDIKKVLAYSTVSQLGYMMLGLGTGAWLPAVFHVFTHAFFKCCLFLCAGSISHSGSHHSFDMKKDMGGLRKAMPVTFAAWIVSTLALTGVAPFAGFWSKDEIIDNVGHNGYTVLYWVGLGGAALTAMYMTRATYLTFFGEPRGAAAGEHFEDHADDDDLLVEEYEPELAMAGGGLGIHDDATASHGHGASAQGVPHEAPDATDVADHDGDHSRHDAATRTAAASGSTRLDVHAPEIVRSGRKAVHSSGPSGSTRIDFAVDHGDDGHDDGDHGAHDDHGPHESGKLILIPIVVLAFFATFAGFSNATPLGESWEYVKKYVEPRPEAVAVESVLPGGPGESLVVVEPGFRPVVGATSGGDPTANNRASEDEGEGGGGEEGGHSEGCGRTVPADGSVCFFPAVDHAEPELTKIALSIGVVAVGYALAIGFCLVFYKRCDPRLVGLTERNSLARAGHTFLVKKYYLDHIYENGVVRAVAHPIAQAAYWVNQNVLDGAVNAVGEGGKRTGNWVYDNIDQKVVDGAVNGSGMVASETGHGLQPVQSGKVSQYGALLFGAAALGAIALVIINVN